jgi:hypothetical protein
MLNLQNKFWLKRIRKINYQKLLLLQLTEELYVQVCFFKRITLHRTRRKYQGNSKNA